MRQVLGVDGGRIALSKRAVWRVSAWVLIAKQRIRCDEIKDISGWIIFSVSAGRSIIVNRSLSNSFTAKIARMSQRQHSIGRYRVCCHAAYRCVDRPLCAGYLHAWETGSQAKAGVGRWITFYNHHRPHTAHGGQPPAVVYFTTTQTDQQVQAVA